VRAIAQANLLHNLPQGIQLTSLHQIIFPHEEEEVLERGVEVRDCADLLQLGEVVGVDDGEDAENARVDDLDGLQEALGEGRR
jgi:hypothetical protein